MLFLAIRKDAVEEIISERTYQSLDFSNSRRLLDLITGRNPDVPLQNIDFFDTLNGRIIFSRGSSEDRFLVVDIVASQIFERLADSEIVLFLQKLMRFSVKHWAKGVMGSSEKVLNGKNAVIFPYPISQMTGTRISIALSPDSERLNRRNRGGLYLLVYRIGQDGGGGPNQDPDINVFRKFLAELPQNQLDSSRILERRDQLGVVTVVQSTTLGKLPSQMDMHQDFETWMHMLTEQQLKFVTQRSLKPSRIEGPAGTGKTASLCLSAIYDLRDSRNQGVDRRLLFVTHSEATRKNIETVIQAMGGSEFLGENTRSQYLRIETLQSFCAEILSQEVSETEYMDNDAFDAKQLQFLYIQDSVQHVEPEYSTYSNFMSTKFIDFLNNEPREVFVTMLQHEISVVIKGRAQENFSIYKQIRSLTNGLPAETDGDKAYIWQIFCAYRAMLEKSAQFDTDDIVITALAQLSTPIWRRRRQRDGFDRILIDECHLFNMNELSVFHHLTKSTSDFPISFAVDRSQAIGDRGWVEDIDTTTLLPDQKDEISTFNVRGIFRCSPQVVNFAFSVTSSGASLFTNFDDPLVNAHSNMNFVDEQRSRVPRYYSVENDKIMIDQAWALADRMRVDLGTTRGDIAVIAFDELVFHALVKVAEESNRPVVVIKNRGDQNAVNEARNMNKFVLSLPDYVGGLEFDGVVLVAVDEGRVPPISVASGNQSQAFLRYSSLNRLYVSISRARYLIDVIGVKERGPSELMASAIYNGTLTQK